MYFLADLKLGHCVKLTFFEGKFDGSITSFLHIRLQKST